MSDVFTTEIRISAEGFAEAGIDNFSLVPVTEVDIDIKPGSDPNAINPAGSGLTPVAILTADTFDATTVSPITVRFGPAGASLEHQLGHLKDVDSDGDLDLVLHFPTQATGIQCGDSEASLTGETFGGQSIQGSDSVVTAGCSADSIQVDQFQLDGSEQNQAISSNFLGSRGQSFTVGKSGLLHAIELSLFEIGSGGDLTVTILDLSGGDLSTAPILGSVAVPESAIGRAPTMLTLARVTATLIDLSSLNLNVNEGDVLAFRLSSVRELPNLYAVRTAIFSDLYAGGAFFARNVFLAVGDMAFKTFIAVPEPDQADIVATSNQGNLVGIDLEAGTARLIGATTFASPPT